MHVYAYDRCIKVWKIKCTSYFKINQNKEVLTLQSTDCAKVRVLDPAAAVAASLVW